MSTIGVRVASVRVDVDQRALTEFAANDPGIRRDMYRRSRNMTQAARGYVRVRTGLLRGSIRGGVHPRADGMIAEVIAGIPGRTRYTMFEHDGTRAHIIRPRRRQALRFVTGGRVVYARRVVHPGTTGSRFLVKALEHGRY